MSETANSAMPATLASAPGTASVQDLLGAIRRNIPLLVGGPVVAAVLSFGYTTYFVAPVFTARTTFLPPQSQQSGNSAAMASLGALATLAGGSGAARSSADQYLALMQSNNVSDRIIEHFKLMQGFGTSLKVDARMALAAMARMSYGKKDGLITVEVDHTDPKLAADIANQYVDELRRITTTLAVTEAQQRRSFFEQMLKQSRDRLTGAQQALLASGFNPGALKAEPKAAADAYARLKAEATGAEVRLQGLRGSLTDSAPEVIQQQSTLNALRAQLSRLEQAEGRGGDGPDYISKYREFKYQEALFDMYARQFEVARLDESREGGLIQVVDPATPPERKSKPLRAAIAIKTATASAAALVLLVLIRQVRRSRKQAALGGH
ncbi:Wzz/FepE/Etk N-terminal domain-containing protein [Ideonella sp. DXS22W]|uniref:Wzz/FepE/Etk N-terminal domain-containing protein n=1 Tax=Pseudaquabacterium inlustre TaxID=2984192 RepID=A0ABU9CHA1_9BURK